MKTFVMAFFLSLISQLATAAFPVPETPVGLWMFNSKYHVKNLRVAEVVDAPDKKPSQRVIELRKAGFLCIHQSPIKYLCTKNISDAQLSKEQENFLISHFEGYQMEFLPTENIPQIIFDSSQQTDYIMAQNVKISGTKYERYGITVTEDGINHFAFSQNGSANSAVLATLKDSIFAIPVVLQSRKDQQTWGYSISVYLEKNKMMPQNFNRFFTTSTDWVIPN